MVLEQLDIHMQKFNLDIDIMPFKNLPKAITDMNVKHKTIKRTENNIG